MLASAQQMNVRTSTSQAWTITTFANIRYPGAVDAGGQGVTYVASYKTNNVIKIAPDGTQTKVGHGFKAPRGVTSYRGDVYVADTENSAVKKVAANGQITLIGSGWAAPTGITADLRGNLYVTDTVNGTVSRVTPKGKMTQLLGQSQCAVPLSVAVDASRSVYVVCDVAPPVILKVTSDGMISEVGSGWNHPLGIAVDGKENVYVSQYKDGIYEYTASGQKNQIAVNSQIPNAKGVAFRNGAVYVCSFANNAIYKVDD